MIMSYIDPVAIQLGGLSIRWYGIIIATAILIGYAVAQKSARHIGFKEDDIVNLLIVSVVVAIITARLYFVLFHLDYYSQNLLEIPMIWQGGIAIHGGLLGAFAMGTYYCYRRNWHPLQVADIVAPSIILAQGIGRWGNFMNHEAHGGPVTRAFLENLSLPNFIIENMYIDGQYYHPAFLYESMWDVLGFILLITLRRHLRVGETFGLYLIWYSIGRFFIEGLRTDSLMIGEVIRVAQLMSITLIIVGILLILIQRFKVKAPLYREVKVLSWAQYEKSKERK
ncbi:prolipoprotein diacylglyceryl transferase [Staphylococcus sp. 17KM0847]|uniref:prolipoprotein diacylglyceryl transferase n=1 Tax=Staphylococcus sp. 17KM0847 TaxID=2583989 RepID=UPI0015DC05A4|nr:prolipoprotein diacylglyceryl transferase [Staphylococcus sp. 17KM0847]QLK85536.1 prolipoprotein diacylglyceryl transferase [Staphylococcus sp. 17KM0847]